MDELDSIESNDALIRFTEGGGPVPAQMHQQFAPMTGLGQTGASGPWYKSLTFLTIAGLGVAAVLLTIYMAKSKNEDSDGSF